MSRLLKLSAGLALAGALMFSGGLFAQTGKDAQSKTAKTATTTTRPPTDKEIADAKAQGLVWVNTATKVYHKEGPYYGKTKHGKFLTEADAQKAGYHAAQEPGTAKKKTSGTKNK